MWYATFDAGTGALVSASASEQMPPAPGLAVRSYDDPPPAGATWSAADRGYALRAALEGELERRYQVWQRWKNTHAEAVARTLSAAVITAVLNRANDAWADYLTALNQWRTSA